MTSTHGVQLAAKIIHDPEVAVPLLILLDAFASARGDPLSEGMMRDVMLFVYTKTDDCEDSMKEFVSEKSVSPTPIAA